VLLVQLPFGAQLRVGALLAMYLTCWRVSRRRIAASISICVFRNDRLKARHKLLRDHFRSLGIAILETGFALVGPAGAVSAAITRGGP